MKNWKLGSQKNVMPFQYGGKVFLLVVSIVLHIQSNRGMFASNNFFFPCFADNMQSCSAQKDIKIVWTQQLKALLPLDELGVC